MPKLHITGIFVLICLIFNNPVVTAQLSIGAGASWVSTNNTYVVLDNFGMQYSASTVSPANIFKFTGNVDVNLGGAILPSYYIIELAKSGNARLLLQRNIHVIQSINFQGGLFHLNNNNVSLATTAVLNNENENSRFIGPNGGQIGISVNLNAPTAANPGSLGAVITAAQNLGMVTINRGHVSQTNGSGSGSSISRYYDISPANNTGLNATLRLYYFDAELNGHDENTLLMWKSSNNLTWTKAGFTLRNSTNNYVEKTGIADFSRWTLSSATDPLPVIGLKLSGLWQNNTVALTWTTVAEYDNDHFDIERMYVTDITFSKISQVPTSHADGNSQTLTAYKYTDASARTNAGTILYRLKQVDKNGQYKYSNTVAVTPGTKKIFIVSVYPTITAGNSIFIQAGNLDLQKMQVQVFDMKGVLVINKQLAYQSQLLPLQVLSSGQYRLVIRSGEWEYSRFFIK